MIVSKKLLAILVGLLVAILIFFGINFDKPWSPFYQYYDIYLILKTGKGQEIPNDPLSRWAIRTGIVMGCQEELFEIVSPDENDLRQQVKTYCRCVGDFSLKNYTLSQLDSLPFDEKLKEEYETATMQACPYPPIPETDKTLKEPTSDSTSEEDCPPDEESPEQIDSQEGNSL